MKNLLIIFFSVLLLAFPQAAMAGSSNDEKPERFDAGKSVKLLADSCIARESELKEFRNWANSKYFRLTGAFSSDYKDSYGFKKGTIWSPVPGITNVFLSIDHDTKICKVSGRIDDTDNLVNEIMAMLDERKELFTSFWDKSDLIIDKKDMIPGEDIKFSHKYTISSEKGLRIHEITLEVYYEEYSLPNFTLLHKSVPVR